MNPKRSTIAFLLLLLLGSVFGMHSFAAGQGEILTFLPIVHNSPVLPPAPRLLYWEHEMNTFGSDFYLTSPLATEPYQLTFDDLNQQRNERIISPNGIFSPDGERIVFYKSNENATTLGLWVMNSNGTQPTKLDESNADRRIYGAEWGADSQTLLYETEVDGAFQGEIHTINVSTGISVTVATDARENDYPVWDPTRLRLYYVAEEPLRIVGVNADGTEPSTVLEAGADTPFVDVIKVLPDQRLLLSIGNETTRDLYTVQPDGSQLTPITNNAVIESIVSVSPDGSKIFFSHQNERQVYVIDTAGTVLWQYTFDCADYLNCVRNFYQSWSPNSDELAFTWTFYTNDDQTLYALYRVATDGSQEAPTLVDQGSNQYRGSAYSPDGRYFAYTKPEPADTNGTILVLDRTTDTTSTLVESEHFLFVWAWQPQP